MKRALAVAVAAALSGCFFTYNNEVERFNNGTIGGRLVLVDAGPGQTPNGAVVTLLWSGLSVTVGADGRFTLLGLPDGTYTLQYLLPAAVDGGVPLIGLRPGLTLPRQADATGDAIDIGNIALVPATRLTGQVTGLDGSGDGGAVVGAFEPNAGNYEGYQTTTDPAGHFTLDVPAGLGHTLWASSPIASGSFSLPMAGAPGLPTALTIALASPDAGVSSGGDLIGNIVVGLPGLGAGANPTTIGLLLGPNGSNVEINPPQAVNSLLSLTGQVPGVGAELDQPLQPGQIGTLYCGLRNAPAAGALPDGGSLVLNDIPLNNIPSFVGHPTALGQITWLPNATFYVNGVNPPNDYLSDAGVDVGPDAGTSDAGLDSGVDAGPDAGTSDAGLDSGVDAGPPSQWALIGTLSLPQVGYPPSSFLFTQFDGGQVAFYGAGGSVFASIGSNASLMPEVVIAGNGSNSGSPLAAASDPSTGLPALLSATYGLDPQTQLLVTNLAISEPSTTGWQTTPLTYSQGFFSNNTQALLLPGDPMLTIGGVAGSLWAFYVDPISHQTIDLAVFTSGDGGFVVAARYAIGDGGYDQMPYTANFYGGLVGAPCTLPNKDPGACFAFALQPRYGNPPSGVYAMSIDLADGGWTINPVAQEPPDSGLSTYPGTPTLQALANGGFSVGWIEHASSPSNGGSAPTPAPTPPGTDAGLNYFAWTTLSTASFACTGATCPTLTIQTPPLTDSPIDALLLTWHDDPLVFYQFTDAGAQPMTFGTRQTGYDAYDLTQDAGTHFPPGPWLDQGMVPQGYVDSLGHPVVAVMVDAGTYIAPTTGFPQPAYGAQIYMYTP